MIEKGKGDREGERKERWREEIEKGREDRGGERR